MPDSSFLSLPSVPLSMPQTLQQLPPKAAHLALQVAHFAGSQINGDFGPFKAHCPPSETALQGKGVLLAVSGGADSLCLLLLFKALQVKFNLRLEVCHLNHGLRPSAALEAQWVEDLCQHLHLPCHTSSVNIKELTEAKNSDLALEEAGRKARYAFFEQTRRAGQLDYIATAHNLNDLAEDALMRLLRGCGWPEFGGMPAFDARRGLLRPLLLTPRASIEQMLKNCALSWLEDESNSSDHYLRNRVRRHILPLFLKENTGFLQHVQTLWQLARADEFYWQSSLKTLQEAQEPKTGNEADCGTDKVDSGPANGAFSGTGSGDLPCPPRLCLPFKLLRGQAKAVRLRLYRVYLNKLAALFPEQQFFTPAKQLFELDRAVQRRLNGQGSGLMRLQTAGGAEVVVEKGQIVFRSV